MKRVLLLFLVLTGSNPLHAQTRPLPLTNTAAIATVRKSVAFDAQAVRALTATGDKGRMKIYSIGANHTAVATNEFTVNAPLPPATANTKWLYIIPTGGPVTTNQLSLSQTRTVLPMKVAVSRQTGGSDGPATLLLGEVFLSAVESPLRWNPELKAYATKIAIGVDFPEHPEIKRLPAPLTLQLLTLNATIENSDVIITEAGPPYLKVGLKCSDARQESSVTAHHPLVQGKPLKIACAIELGELRVDVSDQRVAGYGLGTSKVTVRRLGKDGIEIRDAAPLEVALVTTLGKLDSGNTVTIPENRTSVDAELRSVGRGSAEITAESRNVKSSPRTVTFVFPTGLLVATLLGGLVGGFGRWLKGKKTWRPLATRLMGGLAFGILIVAAAYAGIIFLSLPPVILTTELGAFVTAGVAGYLGSVAADKLVRRFT
jgi:hypothetical protein